MLVASTPVTALILIPALSSPALCPPHSVFPAAIEKDILMAVHVTPASSEDAASTEDSTVRVRLANTTPRFEATTFSSRVDDPSGVTLLHEGAERWANYFKVAFKVRCVR